MSLKITAKHKNFEVYEYFWPQLYMLRNLILYKDAVFPE